MNKDTTQTPPDENLGQPSSISPFEDGRPDILTRSADPLPDSFHLIAEGDDGEPVLA